MSAEWTAEEISNIQAYGICWTCGKPRQPRLYTDGHMNFMYNIACDDLHSTGIPEDWRPATDSERQAGLTWPAVALSKDEAGL